ncbi:DNA topoisomerase IV subunit B [Nitrosomonas nitrosa]|uniref:DNA topoisomerase IV subunit B n=1 Tax=Nitrosomonas nitrosa TaxID=52442 RepID=UPI000D30BB46|nr:DNA topoisomerase IV subunit B [Nitrosomonas nitrosa]
MAKQTYDESSIRVLRKLEPIQLRPGMYTRTTDPTHMVVEAIDNAVDEAMAGHAKHIEVTLYRDGSVAVADDGRGIPVGLHPEEKVPTIQVVFQVIHSGGKFTKGEADSGYKFTGGLHGVGVSVTNALSSRLEVEVKRDGTHYRIVFAEGEVIEPLTVIGQCGARNTGTALRIWPNAKYFDSPSIHRGELEHLLRAKAMLLPGVKVLLNIETATEFDVKEWHFSGGIAQYLDQMIAEDEPIAPVFCGEKYLTANEIFTDGEGVQWALAWVAGSGGGESYVNLIPTMGGGTHEAGLRDVVFNSVRTFAEQHGLMQRNVKLAAEDVWAKLRFVLAIRMVDPSFSGQTKEKLSSREAVKLVGAAMRDALDLWLNAHVAEATKIAEQAIKNAIARGKAAKTVERKKSTGVAVMPGKLTDSELTGPDAELFLVEGDSAGGSAKAGRDKETQAILPLRGKGMNSWEVAQSQILANQEIHNIAVSLAIDPHKLDSDVDMSTLRYGKIIILSDADDDGSHIQALLLTLFFRHFPKIIQHGHVYIAQPPLFRVDVPAQGKSKPPRKLYALDQAELDILEARLRQEGIKEGSWAISRFKGLGEMDAVQLWETTLCPDTRRLVRISLGDVAATVDAFDTLMGRSQASARKELITIHGNEVEADI